MYKILIFVLVAAVASMAALAEPPTLVVPVSPVDGGWLPVVVPLQSIGITSGPVVVYGALRGIVRIEGDNLVYVPNGRTFPQTDFDLFRVAGPSPGSRLNVAVVRAASTSPKLLVATAGATATADPGWQTVGRVVWDPASGAYVVHGNGDIGFDFNRDGVEDLVFEILSRGGQSGSGSTLTLRPPPPPPPGGNVRLPPVLVYQGGGNGGETWELWLNHGDEGYELELGLRSESGSAARLTAALPPGPEVRIDLDAATSQVVLRLTGSESSIHYLSPPVGFGLDRLRHRFGNLGPASDALHRSFELDDLRVTRSYLDLARQVVAVDSFDAAEWEDFWTAAETGALRLIHGGRVQVGRARDRELAVNLDQVRVLGPDHLTRFLAVPRLAMTCRFGLDLSALTTRGLAPGVVKAFALLDGTRADPGAQEHAALLVRRQDGPTQVRLLAAGITSAVGTPWISVPGDSATVEVQWRKTAVGETLVDLWIDGCGPQADCRSGWQLSGAGQPGLVTAVRLGALEASGNAGGELRFDDVACAGDSWIKAE